MHLNIISSRILQMKFDGSQHLLGAVQKIVSCSRLIYYHIAVGDRHRNLLDDVITELGDGIEGTQVRACYVNVINWLQADKA